MKSQIQYILYPSTSLYHSFCANEIIEESHANWLTEPSDLNQNWFFNLVFIQSYNIIAHAKLNTVENVTCERMKLFCNTSYMLTTSSLTSLLENLKCQISLAEGTSDSNMFSCYGARLLRNLLKLSILIQFPDKESRGQFRT